MSHPNNTWLKYVIDGVEYENLVEAHKVLAAPGVKIATVRQRLSRGMDIKQAMVQEPIYSGHAKPVTWRGMTFPTETRWCYYTDIDRHALDRAKTVLGQDATYEEVYQYYKPEVMARGTGWGW